MIATLGKLTKEMLAQNVRVIDILRPDVANAIRNCLKLVEDVSPMHLDLL